MSPLAGDLPVSGVDLKGRGTMEHPTKRLFVVMEEGSSQRVALMSSLEAALEEAQGQWLANPEFVEVDAGTDPERVGREEKTWLVCELVPVASVTKMKKASSSLHVHYFLPEAKSGNS